MSGLPFVQKPATPKTRRCGNAKSGIVEFPVLGGLTVGETKTMTQITGNQNTVFIASAKCATRIAEKEGITLEEAFNLVKSSMEGQALEGQAEEAYKRNQNDIDKLRELCMEQGNLSQRALVIALVRSRLNMPDWSKANDDVDELHNVLFQEIAAFGAEEQAAEETEAAEPPTEEALKKQPRASRNGKRSITTGSVGS